MPEFKKIPPTYVALVVVGLVAVGVISFYVGRTNGLEQAQRQSQTAPTILAGQPPRPLENGLVRLPPKRFENWTLACVQTAAKATHCGLVLNAINGSNKKRVLSLAITRDARGKTVLIAVTPPGAILSAGVHLTPGTAAEMVARFMKCGQGACEAAALFDAAAANAFTSAATTTVTFVAGDGKPVSIKIPTSGFAAGYAAWQAAMPAPADSATASSTPKPAAPQPAGN